MNKSYVKLGGKPKINLELKNRIHFFMENNSELGANRTAVVGKDITGEKIRKTVRHRFKPLNELYTEFIKINSNKDKLSFSGFCTNIGSEFKSPRRATDMCDWELYFFKP